VRIACLLVPDLPLRAELRAHPEQQGQAVAISSGPDPRAEILVASPEATAAGVLPGSAATHARAVCPGLRIASFSPALDSTARAAVLDIALSFSPRAILMQRGEGPFAGEAAALLDATGIAPLFHSEQGFAGAIAARAESLGVPGIVSVASSRGVALLAARELARAFGHTSPSTTVVLDPKSEADFLAPLAIDLLAPSDRLAQALSRFGVRTVRDLLRMPEDALALRLGDEVRPLMARARGSEPEALLPLHSDPCVREAMDFECPIDHLEPLQFALRGLLARLTQRLSVRGLACGPLDLEMTLCGGGRDARQIGSTAPTNDVRVLLRLVSLALQEHPPRSPIESACISTVGKLPRKDQLDLFRPPGPSPTTLDRTLSELESLCGEGRVGAPEVADDHRPSQFRIAAFAPDRPSANRSEAESGSKGEYGGHRAPSSPGELAIWALRPPVAARVRTEKGFPAEIRSAVASGPVIQASGPWRTTGQWWSEEGRFASDHFDVQVGDGTVLRLCFDWVTRLWHIDGIYD
jgi:protein ImuB